MPRLFATRLEESRDYSPFTFIIHAASKTAAIRIIAEFGNS